MKMVAASRLKKAKQMVETSRPYADKIQEMIENLAANVSARGSLDQRFPLLTGNGAKHTHLLVVFSSDRGLCGGLNSSVVKLTKQRVKELTTKGYEVKIFCVGKKAHEQLHNLYSDRIIGNSFGIFRKEIDYNVAKELAQKLAKLFNDKEFNICEVIYSKFKSAIAQEQICKQIIPAPYEQKEAVQPDFAVRYEPGDEEVLTELLPKNIAVQIYNELLESSASEQGARMAAMEAASNNAGKMIKELTLVYNRTRQANITKELIDIISGANVA